MSQQTAVEWLMETMKKTDVMDWDLVFIQAKAMEKTQIVNAWDLSRRDIDYLADGEKYYNNNYNI